MANQLLNISMITNEALFVLENELTFTNCVTREYDDRFAIAGAKIGYTVNVRRPARFVGTVGPNLNVEDFYESSIPVTLSTQFHIDTQFTEADLLLSLDEFSMRVIKPSVRAVANRIDADGTLIGMQWASNAVGVPGTPLSSRAPALQAGAFMDSEGCPPEERCLILDQWTHSYMVDALAGLFNPQAQISEQYRKGMMGRDTLGFDWYKDQNMVSYTPGAGGGTPTVNGANQGLTAGWAQTSNILTTAWSNTTNVLNVGDIVTFAGCYAVNPQNRRSYGGNRLRQFVVRPFVGTPSAGTFTSSFATANNGSGPVGPSAGTIAGGYYTSGASTGPLQFTVAPAIITAGQFQNVSASPTAGGAVTIFGAGFTGSSPQNLAIHKSSFTIASADLPLPGGVHFAGRAADPQTGLSIRVVRQYTVNNDSIPCRFDVLYGWAPIYSELAVRAAG